MRRSQSETSGSHRSFGSRSNSSCSSLGSCSQAGVAFEIRDGSGYCVYSDHEQQLLLKALAQHPPPAEVWLGQAHVVRSFDRIEAGGACQVNVLSDERRHVRIRPPATPRSRKGHRAPGCDECSRLRHKTAELQDALVWQQVKAESLVQDQRRLEAQVASLQAERSRLEHAASRLQATCEKQAAALKESRPSRQFTEAQAVEQVAELLVREATDLKVFPEERRSSQRRLLVSLHPDKCPAPQLATQLTQEMQNSKLWIA